MLQNICLYFSFQQPSMKASIFWYTDSWKNDFEEMDAMKE